MTRNDLSLESLDPHERQVWDRVAEEPPPTLWGFQGVPLKLIASRTMHSFLDDNLLSRAAELGYYFLFALFPMLVSASSLLGLAARGAATIYTSLLSYLALVVPHSAYAIVIETFNQTTAAATSGKVTLGLAAALWSGSVGFSAIQDGMNTVYKVRETRPYWKARGAAILVTVLLSILVTVNLAVLLGGDFLAHIVYHRIWHHWLAVSASISLHIVAGTIACVLLLVQFGVVYYFAPDLKTKRWQWLTPGSVLGLAGWVLASLGLRLYLHFFNSYTLTYGSLGAVIILLTWFYITGLMLLLGAEINSEIAAAVVERKIKASGELSAPVAP